jgi:hypothetical protein
MSDDLISPRTLELDSTIGEVTLSAQFIVVPLAGLKQALKNKPPEIIVQSPPWLPHVFFYLFLLIVYALSNG